MVEVVGTQLDMCVGMHIFRCMCHSRGKAELTPLYGPYISLMVLWEFCAGFCRCQMCLHPLPCSPFPSLWFLHGRRVSIRASGLQEPEHSSVSVLPREVQPCLGQCICSLGGEPGEEGNPGAPMHAFFTLDFLSCAPGFTDVDIKVESSRKTTGFKQQVLRGDTFANETLSGCVFFFMLIENHRYPSCCCTEANTTSAVTGGVAEQSGLCELRCWFKVLFIFQWIFFKKLTFLANDEH